MLSPENLNAPILIEAKLADYSLQTPVSNAMVFVQTDGFDYFLLDNSQTFASPDPPMTGQLLNFTLGGIWLQDEYLDHTNFQCHIFGALVYNEDFPYSADVLAGGWSNIIPFDVPSVAPQTTYYITVSGVDADGNTLFSVDTDFKF